KQRTVIARALAKDSPIILADEPTGNLDYATSAEIVDLLKEVSKDKLLIMVTHNFEQVEKVATRHIRIYDGAVEGDTRFENSPQPSPDQQEVSPLPPAPLIRQGRVRQRPQIGTGLKLGRTIFTARPRLSFFRCLLMIVGSLGMYFATSLCGGGIGVLFEDYYIFTPIDGRVVLAKRSGELFTKEQVKDRAEAHGARDYLHIDSLLDGTKTVYFNDYDSVDLSCCYEEPPKPDVGRYPEKENELLLSLPLHYSGDFGKRELKNTEVQIDFMDYKVVGVHYYSDNNLEGKAYLTKDGFAVLTACDYIFHNESPTLTVTLQKGEEYVWGESLMIYPCFSLEGKTVKVFDETYEKLTRQDKDLKTGGSIDIFNPGNEYDSTEDIAYQLILEEDRFVNDKEVSMPASAQYAYNGVLVSTDLLKDVGFEILERSYTQCSLLFANQNKAEKAIKALHGDTYIALSSYTTYQPHPFETILVTISAGFLAILWVLFIVFISFFIHICSTRTLSSFKGEMAIMRSMGLSENVIKTGVFTRMLLTLIPGFVTVLICGMLVAFVPEMNGFFSYLYPWQYLMLFFGMLAIVIRVTGKQMKKLFGESVKKSLSKNR
ncbi:MAG: hypothetical protein IJY89_06685, partial [Clostridia bacterium]|nr:hypothetical protein [Clostridia bacterium]